ARAGDVATINALLDDGLDPQVRDGLGRTLVHFHAQLRDETLLRRLLELGLDVNTRDRLGHTPVWLAADDGASAAIIRDLEDAGADVFIPDDSGHIAMQAGEESDPWAVSPWTAFLAT